MRRRALSTSARADRRRRSGGRRCPWPGSGAQLPWLEVAAVGGGRGRGRGPGGRGDPGHQQPSRRSPTWPPSRQRSRPVDGPGVGDQPGEAQHPDRTAGARDEASPPSRVATAGSGHATILLCPPQQALYATSKLWVRRPIYDRRRWSTCRTPVPRRDPDDPRLSTDMTVRPRRIVAEDAGHPLQAAPRRPHVVGELWAARTCSAPSPSGSTGAATTRPGWGWRGRSSPRCSSCSCSPPSSRRSPTSTRRHPILPVFASSASSLVVLLHVLLAGRLDARVRVVARQQGPMPREVFPWPRSAPPSWTWSSAPVPSW